MWCFVDEWDSARAVERPARPAPMIIILMARLVVQRYILALPACIRYQQIVLRCGYTAGVCLWQAPQQVSWDWRVIFTHTLGLRMIAG